MFTSFYLILSFLVVYFTLCEGITVLSEEDPFYDFDSTHLTKVIEFFLTGPDINRYYLYTRKNPNVPQNITYGNDDTIVKSNYDARKELIVIVNGWGDALNESVNEIIKSSYLKVADVNVIVVDWGIGDEFYLSACLRVPSVGKYLGNFLQWVLNTADGDWDRVHLIGFSLGGHIVGNAGREVGGLPKRVTASGADYGVFSMAQIRYVSEDLGFLQILSDAASSGLDPAGPLWGLNPYSLDSKSGQYVEVIHTNFVGRGLVRALGHVDFYPNGGRKQPGCKGVSCAHDRVYELFASSLENKHLVGRRCINVFFAVVGLCFGDSLAMGNTDLSKTGSGIYYLSTTDTWPF